MSAIAKHNDVLTVIIIFAVEPSVKKLEFS